MGSYAWVLWAVISAVGSITGTYFAKRLVDGGNMVFLFGVIPGYLIASVAYIIALRSERLVMVEGLWGVAALIFTLAVGFFVFHEKVTVQEGIGITLAGFATILMIWKP